MIEPILSDDTFLADVQRARKEARALHVWWLGQSGFLLQWDGKHVLLDPYLSDSLTAKYTATDKPHLRMTRRVIAPERLDFIDIVTASHIHTDHLDPETLQPLFRANLELELIAPAAILEEAGKRAGIPWGGSTGLDADDGWEVSGFQFHAVPAAHNTIERDEHGRCKFLGYVIKAGPFHIYHSGDTLLYEGLAERLKKFNVDVALLPINGNLPERRVAGNLNGVEAANLAKSAGAKLAVPCHYEMFEFNTASPDEFKAECARIGQSCRVLRAGERLSLNSTS